MSNDIYNYIKSQFNNNEVDQFNNEINEIFNNLINEKCYYAKTSPSTYSTNGISNQANSNNYSFLIPNLFRLCYVQDNLYIPNICNLFVHNNINYNFLPKILDENTIKAFLYFNFPVNIKNSGNINYLISKIIYIDKGLTELDLKKRNTTYSSYTLAISIYNELYKDSMLTNLINFSSFITNTPSVITQNLVVNDFNISWDFTNYCTCYSTDVLNNTYISGNFKYNAKVTSVDAFNIYNIGFIYEQALLYNNDQLDTELFLVENYIFPILKYANYVYQDILLQIQYFISGSFYCRKKYMNVENIPNLLSLYNKFYLNQIRSIEKELPSISINDVKSLKISIVDYLANFNLIYLTEFPNIYFIKNILLNGNTGDDAISVYSNIKDWTIPNINIIYYYYYVNVTYPSAVSLNNINTILPSGSIKYTNVVDFISTFNKEFSVYSKSNSCTLVNNYNQGLYPSGGTLKNPENIGYVYSFNNSNILQYLVYETIESYSPYDPSTEADGVGVALAYYKNML